MRFRRWTALVVACGCVLTMHAAAASSPRTQIQASTGGEMPATVPSPNTPAIQDGAVHAVVRMGEVVVVGGTFTRVASAGSDEVLDQPYLAAYDRRTGQLLPGFRPRVDKPVQALASSEDGASVFVGGEFDEVNGQSRSSLTRLDLGTGNEVDGFAFPGTDADVRTMVRRENRLYIGGAFSRVGDTSRHGLAAVRADTGLLSGYQLPSLSGTLGGVHGSEAGRTNAAALDVTADGGRMVVVGNFARADGEDRIQVAVIELADRGTVANWATTRYRPRCAPKLHTYMRDVQFAPSGDYFVVVTSGGPFRTTLCDTAARWETSGAGQKPTWVDATGGDTLLSVAVTSSAVYVGGHQRWMNNAGGSGEALPGAVPRPSLAALNPVNGLPHAWNPGRHPRSHGVSELWADDAGLIVGGDTDWIGNREYRRPRIASFPNEGSTLPAEEQSQLPGTVYLWSSYRATSDRDTARAIEFTGVRPEGPARTLTGENLDVRQIRGMFAVDRTIFFGHSDGYLYRRTVLDGELGAPVRVDPYNDPVWSDVQTGSGETYRGQIPDFYGELPSVTGMFYWRGRLYYTRNGSDRLWWRSFSTDSGIVGARAHSVRSGPDWSATCGLFRSGGTLYYAQRGGEGLYRVGFVDGRPSGVAVRVQDATALGVGWNSRGAFVFDLDRID